MKVRDVMTRDVHIARPGDTLREVAERMARGDFGFIPVADGDRLIGTITDRDIVVRAVAGGASPDAPVIEYISRDAQTVLGLPAKLLRLAKELFPRLTARSLSTTNRLLPSPASASPADRTSWYAPCSRPIHARSWC